MHVVMQCNAHVKKFEYIKESIMGYISPSKFLQWMLSSMNIYKMNNSPIENKYKILGILVLNAFYSM